MKFYEVKQQLNNLSWSSLGYFRKQEDAEKYSTLYNTKVVVYPIKVIEHSFKNIKDYEDEFKDQL
jgi:hypothetical protein